MIHLNGKYTNAVIMIDNVEEACLQQIANMISHPAFTNPVIIMPDTHAGKGSVIGFTMKLTDKVIPNVVGVDVGCGVTSVKLDSLYETNVKVIDKLIKDVIPTGTNIHSHKIVKCDELLSLFNEATLKAQQFIDKYNYEFETDYFAIRYDEAWLQKKLKTIGMDITRFYNSIGTLGSGNHFLELGIAKSDQAAWLTIHSGSRKFGETVCKYHQKVAKENLDHKRDVVLRSEIDRIRKEYAHSPELIQTKINNIKKDLCLDFDVNVKGMEYLEGDAMIDYFFDMIFAQEYASLNRLVMLRLIKENALNGSKVVDMIESIHNYIDFSDLIMRKGAINAGEDVRVVIPFNMEDGLILGVGMDNEYWNSSAPHGAGRVLSRSKAKQTLDLEEARRGMEEAGVYTSSLTIGSLDEAKGAYKDSEMIEEAIKHTVEITDEVVPILNIKDSTNGMSWKEKKNKNK